MQYRDDPEHLQYLMFGMRQLLSQRLASSSHKVQT